MRPFKRELADPSWDNDLPVIFADRVKIFQEFVVQADSNSRLPIGAMRPKARPTYIPIRGKDLACAAVRFSESPEVSAFKEFFRYMHFAAFPIRVRRI